MEGEAGARALGPRCLAEGPELRGALELPRLEDAYEVVQECIEGFHSLTGGGGVKSAEGKNKTAGGGRAIATGGVRGLTFPSMVRAPW